MDDLISRKAVLEIFGDVHPLDYNAKAYVKKIEELPTIPAEGDLISRKAVLELRKYNLIGGIHTVNVADIEKLPTIPQTAEWIPVSERLPERDVDVLTYHKNVSFDYQYISWIDDYSGKWAGFVGNFPDEVLAWMPLPEPYKAKSEDKDE